MTQCQWIQAVTDRIPLGRAHSLSNFLSREVRRAGLPIDHLSPVGGLRRFAPHMSRVALLAVAPAARHARILNDLARLPGASAVSTSPSAVVLGTERGAITVHLAAPEHAGSALVWHSGAGAHVRRLVLHGAARQVTLRDGILQRHGVAREAPTEADCYDAFGLPFIEPELRHGDDEILAAAEGRLPMLLEEPHIRGDLHMHTNWSDGRDSIEGMAVVAGQLGYEYIAITDHSERSMAARTLGRIDIARQREAIAQVREQVGSVEILHGVEIEIMPDGSLDFDDTVLEEFDVVLASLHEHTDQGPEELMSRYLAAVHHPLVHIITHPANRTPGQSAGYDLDFDRLFEAAARTGTALEVDGAPAHLDMDGDLARRAVAAGATLTVDSDAHRAEWLGRQMRFGVGTARRGWVRREQVLNTRPLSEVKSFLARKRMSRS